MRIPLSITAAIALSSQVTAHSPKALRGLDNVYKHHDYIDHQVRRNADAIINHGLYHGRNVIPFPSSSLAASSTSSPPSTSSASASTEPQGWEFQTQVACMTALSAYVNTINPSGMAVCYNILYFNNATGAFEADLRLYRVSEPSGEWFGFTEQAVSVGLSYPGAAVAASSMPAKRREGLSSWPRDRVERRDVPPPQMLQVLDFVGMVNGELMAETNNDQEQQALLLPHITLSGLSHTSVPITTTLSSTAAAAFVNGVFAKKPKSKLQSAASAATSTPTPFVLPGTRLGVFPVGLVVVGGWTVLFLAVVGWGTVGRVAVRGQYRRRVRRGNMGVFGTI